MGQMTKGRTVVRWLCSISFLVYGFAKVNGAQFTMLDSQLALPLAEVKPFWFVWYFFGYSDLYKGFIASIEIVGGILLAIPRTSLLGALVLLPPIVNIVVVDLVFQVDPGGTLMAILLTCGILYVIIPHARRLLSTALLDHPTTRAGNAVMACGVVGACIFAFSTTHWIANYNNRHPTAVDGRWEVISSEDAGLRRVFFERNRAHMVVFMNEDGGLNSHHFEVGDGRIRIWDQWLSKGDLIAQGRLTEQDVMELRFETGVQVTLKRRFGPKS